MFPNKLITIKTKRIMTLKEIKAKYFVLADNFVKNKYSLHNNVYGRL